jgi:hypothetical protein
MLRPPFQELKEDGGGVVTNFAVAMFLEASHSATVWWLCTQSTIENVGTSNFPFLQLFVHKKLSQAAVLPRVAQFHSSSVHHVGELVLWSFICFSSQLSRSPGPAIDDLRKISQS